MHKAVRDSLFLFCAMHTIHKGYSFSMIVQRGLLYCVFSKCKGDCMYENYV